MFQTVYQEKEKRKINCTYLVMHYFNTNVLDLFKFNFLKNEIPRKNFILTFYFVDKIFIYALDYSSYSTSKNQPNPTYNTYNTIFILFILSCQLISPYKIISLFFNLYQLQWMIILFEYSFPRFQTQYISSFFSLSF